MKTTLTMALLGLFYAGNVALACDGHKEGQEQSAPKTEQKSKKDTKATTPAPQA